MKRRPTHPGVILKQQYMEPLGITVQQLTDEYGFRPAYLEKILAGKEGIGFSFAEFLSEKFETPDDFWLKLQDNYDDWEDE